MPPSTHLSTLLTPFQSRFSAPTCERSAPAQRNPAGPPTRTITTALRHTGQGDTPSFSLYQQGFNRAHGSALKGSRWLLTLLAQTFDAAGGSLTFGLDETLARRWGPRIKSGVTFFPPRRPNPSSLPITLVRSRVTAVATRYPTHRRKPAAPFGRPPAQERRGVTAFRTVRAPAPRAAGCAARRGRTRIA